jgi:hypothetical protein
VGIGGSGADGSQVGPLAEDEIPGPAKTDAPQPCDRGNRTAALGTGLVCVDAPLTVSALQSGTDRLQVFDVGLADGR